jgi:signal transduction histidine kinase/ligand-binding sensor domain-containing protein
MVHTSWTGRDGAPQGITALAQTPDGILWIGSFGGLFTFDGLKFEAFHPKTGSSALPSGTQSLFVSKAGDLWVFPLHGPAARIHQGEVHIYDRVQGEELFTLGHPQQDLSGTLWAVLNERHLVRLGSDDAWLQVPDPLGTAEDISNLFIDSNDTQWIIKNDQLYARFEGATEFAATSLHVAGPTRIAESHDHTLWVIGQGSTTTHSANLQHFDQHGRTLFAPRVRGQINEILFAPDGSLWIAKYEGLERITADRIRPARAKPSEDRPDLYERKSVSKDFDGQVLLSDLDGNIWTGGVGGLDRFERANLIPVIPDSKIGMWHSCVDTHGEVWLANANGNVQLFEAKNGRVTAIQSGYAASNLFCGNSGRIYVLGDHGISLVRGGRIQALPLLPGLPGYGNNYRFLGLVEEPGGDLIAAVGGPGGHGLWKYSSKKWSRFLPELSVPEVCGMLLDAEGRLYLAFTRSGDTVGRIEAGSFTELTGMGAMAFAETSYGIFAYGRKGIALGRRNTFQKFSFMHPEQGRVITGIVESHAGDLWINGAQGIARIPVAEVRAAIADPNHAVSTIGLREGDFVGPDIPLFFRNSAHIDPTGRLWFSTLNGVVSLDPDRLAAPRRPPLLLIRTITADGRLLNANQTFPPDTQYLDVQYFGLDLTSPKDVIYRYRLEGLDTAWQNAGSRTEAIYTHLRPGSYTFQVMASNGNDVWTNPVSSVRFTILPHFYQYRWVQAFSVLASIFLVWLGVSRRIRSVSRAIQIREEGRADERVRIARELHDTLLQGIQGLLLGFHVAAGKVPADHESKKALENALTTADHIILEGRNRVNRLRSEDLTDAELKSLIEGVAANLNGSGEIDFAVERTGGKDSLRSDVADEVFWIAREALTNAFRHSEASRIVVELDYDKHKFRMSCRDNGRGFDVGALQANGKHGHWGLRGMEERAEKIGATVFFASSPGQGTGVQVVVPGRRAYVNRRGFRLFSARGESEIT